MIKMQTDSVKILVMLPVFVIGQYYPVDELDGVSVLHHGSDELEGVSVLHHGSDYSIDEDKQYFKWHMSESRIEEDELIGSGSQVAPVKIGPYRPWSFPPDLGNKKISLGKDYDISNHPGYHTNIIIDPYAKDTSIVKIRTEDLSTGLTVGQTSWSGPGTLTLSALSSLLGGAGVSLSNPPANHKISREARKYKPAYYPTPQAYQTNKAYLSEQTYPLEQAYQYPTRETYPIAKTYPTAQTYQSAHSLPQLKAYPAVPVNLELGGLSHSRSSNKHPVIESDAEWLPIQQMKKPQEFEPHDSLRVLGASCASDYDCSPALNSICGYNSLCKVTNNEGCFQYTCQCPPGTQPTTNRYSTKTSSRHSKRSLRYHQECRTIR